MNRREPPEIHIERVDDEFYKVTVKREDGTFEFFLRAGRGDKDDRDAHDEKKPTAPTLQPA